MAAGHLIPVIGYANLFDVFIIPIGLVTGYCLVLRAKRHITKQMVIK